MQYRNNMMHSITCRSRDIHRWHMVLHYQAKMRPYCNVDKGEPEGIMRHFAGSINRYST